MPGWKSTSLRTVVVDVCDLLAVVVVPIADDGTSLAVEAVAVETDGVVVVKHVEAELDGLDFMLPGRCS